MELTDHAVQERETEIAPKPIVEGEIVGRPSVTLQEAAMHDIAPYIGKPSM